jgi:hypothetical protein
MKECVGQMMLTTFGIEHPCWTNDITSLKRTSKGCLLITPINPIMWVTSVLTITHNRDHYVSLVQRLGQLMVKFINSITRPSFPNYSREKKTIGYKW